MKSKRLAKLIALAVTALLLIGVAIGFAVSAEETTAEIGYINVAYEGQIRLVYDVKNVTLAEGDKLVVLVWEDSQTIEDAKVIDTCEPCRSDAYSRFYSDGFAPKDLRKPVSAVAAVVDGETGDVEVGQNVITYSVYDYVMGRFAYGKNTPDQQNLYTALLDYSAAVQEALYESYKNTLTDAEAKTQAGLDYGYADAYYVINYVKSAYVGGKLTTSVEKHALRAYESVKINADQTYMRRVFEKYVVTDGLDVTYLYNNNGNDVEITKDQLAQGTARYVSLRPTVIGYTTITASYGMEAGTTIRTSSLHGIDTKASDQGTTESEDGVSKLVNGTDSNGNPYILLSKHIAANNGNGKSVQKNVDGYAKGDVWVSEFDISIIGNYGSDLAIGKKNDLTSNISVYQSNVYRFRLDLVAQSGNKISFRNASDGICFENKYVTDTVNQTYKVTEVASNSAVNKISDNTSAFVNSITGENSIAIADLKSIRIEVHHDGAEEREYRTYYYTTDGTKDSKGNLVETKVMENGQHKYDTYTISAATLKLYINGVYWGSTTHGYYYKTSDTDATPRYIDYYNNSKLEFGYITYGFTNNGSYDAHISEWLVTSYDYNTDGTIALTTPDNEINYGTGSVIDYNVTGGIKENYSGVISGNASTPLDKTPTADDTGFAYIDTTDGDGALMMGKTATGNANAIYIKLPDEVVNAQNKQSIVFSTDFYFADGVTWPISGDWIRFRFSEKSGATDTSGSITTFLVASTKTFEDKNRDTEFKFNNNNSILFGGGEWVNFTLVFNCYTLRTDIYLNGVLVSSDIEKISSHPGSEFKYLQIETRGYHATNKFAFYENLCFGMDNTYFGYVAEDTTVTTITPTPQLTKNKDYVTLTNGLTDGDRTGITHLHYSNPTTADGSEALVTWFSDEAMAAISTNDYFVLETDIKFGEIDPNNTGTGGAAYSSWLFSLSITDSSNRNDNSDINHLYNTFEYSASKDILTYNSGKLEFKQNEWHHVKIVYARFTENSGYNKVQWLVYIDDVLVKSVTTDKNSNGNSDMADPIWGVKVKLKNTKNFAEVNIYFDNMTLTQYSYNN